MLWSCGENTETIIYEYDTVAVHDTTIRVDTLSDTLFLPAGPDSYMLFGLICDVSTTHSDSTHQFDSVYAGVTCFADPARNDLHVTVNGDSVGLETAQRDYLLFESLPDLATGSLFPGVNTLALLEATLYEGLVSKDSVSSLRIVVPAWPADTAQPLTYDTLQESIALPQPVDSYTIATSAGPVPYVTNDTALQVNYYRVPGDSALDVTWPDRKSVV